MLPDKCGVFHVEDGDMPGNDAGLIFQHVLGLLQKPEYGVDSGGTRSSYMGPCRLGLDLGFRVGGFERHMRLLNPSNLNLLLRNLMSISVTQDLTHTPKDITFDVLSRASTR